MRTPPISRIARVALLATAAAIACNDSNAPKTAVATKVETSTVPPAALEVGAVVNPQPSVIVRDQRGRPMGDVHVTFSPIGGGAVAVNESVTGSDGVATANGWTLGRLPGTNQLIATIPNGSRVAFTVQGRTGAAAKFDSAAAGSGQQGPVGSTLNYITVRVTDRFGNPVAGETVTFSTTSGSVTPVTAVSDADGRATARWTLGTVSGDVELVARSTNGGSLTIFARALPLAPVGAEKAQGDQQIGLVARPTRTPPGVRVVDRYGNGVPNVVVNFAVTSGGGQVSEASLETDETGVAAPSRWTLGSDVGENRLTATVPSVATTLVFTATAVIPAVSSIEKIGGDGTTIPVARAVVPAPQLRVVDQVGNGISGVTVAFTVISGGGMTTASSAVTDYYGNASVTWVLGPGTGTNTLRVSTPSTAAVDFTASAVADNNPPKAIALFSDQFGVEAGKPVSVFFYVTDAANSPAPGVPVSMSVLTGGGRIDPAVIYTDRDGVATATMTTGPTPAENTTRVSITGGVSRTMTTYGTRRCSDADPLALGTTASGTLDHLDCHVFPNGPIVHPYQITGSTSVVVTGGSSAFFPTAAALDVNGRLRGISGLIGDPGGHYLLGPSSILLGPAAAENITGPYTFTVRDASSDVSLCREGVLMPGHSSVQHLTAEDCAGQTLDPYMVYLQPGETAVVEMSSTDFDPLLELWSYYQDDYYGNNLLDTDDNSGGGTTARLTFNTGTEGFAFAVYARGHTAAVRGAYTISYTVTGGTGAAARRVGRVSRSTAVSSGASANVRPARGLSQVRKKLGVPIRRDGELAPRR